MRLHLTLRVTWDAAQPTMFKSGAMGRLTNALDGTHYDDLHGTEAPTFVFSDLIPPRADYAAGDTVSLVVASPHEEFLSAIASDVQTTPEFNVGEFPLEAVAGEGRDPDVGPPGTTGTFETLSGIYLRPEVCDGEHFDATHEQTGHFREYVAKNVQYRLGNDPTAPDAPDEPADPFEDYGHRKTFAVPLAVSDEHTDTAVATKWHLSYAVRDERHRRVLNHLLDIGVGARTAYGFGCLAPLGTWGDLSGAAHG